MLNDNQIRFKMEPEDLNSKYSDLISKGYIIFYRYHNNTSLTHLQFMNGDLICKQKLKGGDGSLNAYMFNGDKFYIIDRFRYRDTYILREVDNPISCKKCQKYFTKNFIK